MALDVKDLCRFCASNDEFSKDLLSDNNKDVVKFIEEFVQIVVFSNDNLPTKICINCEEKMVSFELFVLECHKTQESLKKMCEDTQTEQLPIKVEDGPTCQYAVKSEVKAEDTEDLCTLNNDASLLMLDMYNDESNMDDQVLDNDIACDPDDDDYEENISIAALKTIKKNKIKRKEITENEAEELKQVLQRSNLKVKDFVKLECKSCELSFKTWCSLRFHFYKIHKCQQYVFCICGFVIKSKSVLYKHVSEHKRESRKLRKENETEENSSDLQYSNRNVKDFIKFLCHCCKKEYSSWYSLRKHTVWAHKVSPIVTCICGIVLKSKSVMYKHVHDHRNPNILSCDKCPRITKTLSALNKHKMRHIPKEQRKFCCASCDKFFTSKDALKSHERSHIPIEDRKIYNCDQCNMKFTTRSSQMSHKRVVHEKIKGYVCDLCGYACGTNGELRQHRAIHSDDKPFVCRTCSKPFKTYSNLKTHMDTHEDTAYECYICRRILNSRRTLRKHLLVHEDKCRHVCSYCNKAFKRRQTLKVHMYTHTGDKPLTCKWCDERFSYASTLRSHRLRCHPEKMAAQHLSYPTYAHNTTQDDYIKNSSEIVNVPAEKNDVEAM